MNVSILNSYNPYNKTKELTLENLNEQIEKRLNGNLKQANGRINAEQIKNSAEEIITPKERDFFKKLFPLDRTQLEKHVVFNRNGKINETNISKGILIDSKA